MERSKEVCGTVSGETFTKAPFWLCTLVMEKTLSLVLYIRYAVDAATQETSAPRFESMHPFGTYEKKTAEIVRRCKRKKKKYTSRTAAVKSKISSKIAVCIDSVAITQAATRRSPGWWRRVGCMCVFFT